MSGVRTNKRAHKTIRDGRSAIGSGIEFGVRNIRQTSGQLSTQEPEQGQGKPSEQRLFEEQVESRLRALGRVVAELTAAPHVGLLMRERDSVRETLVELVVKEEALREILQLAKHSERGTVRIMLWRNIEGALADLEKKAETFGKAACA